MDDSGIKRLGSKIIVQALKDIRAGDESAETWFLESSQVDIILDGLDLFVDKRVVISKVKAGCKLALTGSKW